MYKARQAQNKKNEISKHNQKLISSSSCYDNQICEMIHAI